MAAALHFAETFRSPPNATRVQPGDRHWEIFSGLCRETGVRGKLVPDAYFAALAIESGSEWITTDGDFARFPGLRWRRPF
jgi:predicted nucleic acid-binding protein